MSVTPESFRRAEYDGPSLTLDHCTWCGRGLNDTFYRADGSMICEICAARAIAYMPVNTRGIFLRSVAWGAAAAIALSLVLFLGLHYLRPFGFDWIVIFAAIGIGYGVGRVMRWASHGAGGRRYQVAAALLTYAAISVALSADTLGAGDMPLWALPFLTFAPIADLFLGQFEAGSFQLFIAGVAIRWTWMMLPAWPLKITGPETLSASAAVTEP